jgi:hypothetical protein
MQTLAYGFRVDTLDQLKAELNTLTKVVTDASDPKETIDSSNAEWYQLSQAHAKLPCLVSMMQVVVEHLEQLEQSAERHRLLSHEHQRNGEARMSMRARLLAQHEDRLRLVLMRQLMNSWNDSLLPD